MTVHSYDPMQPNPERDQQLFLDGKQSADVIRLQGEVQQTLSATHIQQLAEQLGSRITEHARTHRELLQIRQTNGVNGDGLPSIDVKIN